MNLRALRAPAVVAATLLSLVAAGCTDPTVTPKSTITGANVFNDPTSYTALIARVYAGLAVSGQQGAAGNPDIQGIDEGFSQYLRLYWETEELPTDEAVIGWNDVGLPEMNTMTWTSSSRMVVAMYYRIFVQVVMANEFLRQTTAQALASRPALTPAVKTEIGHYRAEARFLRALSYWHAIDLFGSVPLIKETDAVGTLPKQASRTDIYNFVVSELTAIKDSLPAPSAAVYPRATSQAANMLLAELYLNAGVYTGTANYAGALTAAGAVIGSGAYSLDPSYRHLFMADNNTSPELIFAVAQDGANTQTWGGMTFLIHASCGGSMSASTYGIDYCWGGFRLKTEAYNFYTATDKRASYFWTSGQNVAVNSIGNFNDGVAAPKFTNTTAGGSAGSNPTFVDVDFPVFRLGEAYLIYAEAAVRTGTNQAQALTYVNALRQRAGVPLWTTADLTLGNILAERGRELLLEGHRRTDLVRYGLFTGGNYIWSWKGGVKAGQSTDAHLNIYPLPATELVANPNLAQNAGY